MYIRSNGESNWDYVMVSKPDVSITYSTSYNGYIFDSDLLPEVTFENSPIEVELKLIEK